MNVALSAIELFSGVGMLGEGLRAGLDYMGIAYRTVCHVEREAYAAGVLVSRMEEGSLDAAPVWSDVTTFDAAAWRGRVDCVVAGFPCQDLSVAGKRAGLDGHRSGLFFEVIRIAADCDARFIFLENVAGIASATATVMDEAEGELDERAAARVVGELADCGWNSEWLPLSASDVGASHGRARWFCLAWRMADASRHDGDRGRNGEGGSRRGVREAGDQLGHAGHVAPRNRGSGEAGGTPEGSRSRMLESAGAGRVLADADQFADERRRRPGVVACSPSAPEGQAHQRKRNGVAADDGYSNVADAGRPRPQGHEQQSAHEQDGRTDGRTEQEPCRSTTELHHDELFAPGPADPRWADIIREQSYLAPALEPDFRGTVNGMAFGMGDCRAARLRCIGNGVVPLCAALAFVVLARRAGLFA